MKRSASVLLLAPLAACSDSAPPPKPPAPPLYASHSECSAETKDGRGCHRGSGSGAAASWYYINSGYSGVSPRIASAPGYIPTPAIRSRPRQAITNARMNFTRSGVPSIAARGGFGSTGRSMSSGG